MKILVQTRQVLIIDLVVAVDVECALFDFDIPVGEILEEKIKIKIVDRSVVVDITRKDNAGNSHILCGIGMIDGHEHAASSQSVDGIVKAQNVGS